MSPEVQRRLFDPFFTTKGPGGSGLGMSIVYGIVQRHGGTIEVDSKLQEGTTFRIGLVAAESGAASSAEARASDWGRIEKGSGSVLVVDDEAEIRQLVADILEAAGYGVEMAENGAEAVKILNEAPFDLVVTDLGMPGMSGWEVAEQSRRILPETPVLLLTGWGAALSSEEVEKRGIARALQKPFDMQDLLATVHSLLEARTLKKSA
jgi:CheY-like chemotaxis protein